MLREQEKLDKLEQCNNACFRQVHGGFPTIEFFDTGGVNQHLLPLSPHGFSPEKDGGLCRMSASHTVP